jgi:hypothetical protein
MILRWLDEGKRNPGVGVWVPAAALVRLYDVMAMK